MSVFFVFLPILDWTGEAGFLLGRELFYFFYKRRGVWNRRDFSYLPREIKLQMQRPKHLLYILDGTLTIVYAAH